MSGECFWNLVPVGVIPIMSAFIQNCCFLDLLKVKITEGSARITLFVIQLRKFLTDIFKISELDLVYSSGNNIVQTVITWIKKVNGKGHFWKFFKLDIFVCSFQCWIHLVSAIVFSFQFRCKMDNAKRCWSL